LSNDYNHPIPPLPKSLKHLEFQGVYNLPIAHGILPANLKELIFMEFCRFNQPFDIGVLPAGLQRLELGDVLSSSLQVLILTQDFNQSLSTDVLPISLQSITLPSAYPIEKRVNIPSTCLIKRHVEYNYTNSRNFM
jgi:hypothetical protein